MTGLEKGAEKEQPTFY